ncbi:hypothetical protein N0V92_010142 [Colletotrichum tropicale]|nr:hypothetical protein N0V92_010142 [Colletotrichum tropicale]
MAPVSTSLNVVSIDSSTTPSPPSLETEPSSRKPSSSHNAADERSSTTTLEHKQATASATSGTPAVFLAEPAASDPVLAPASFKHPGLLHTDNDFARIRAKVNAGREPWNTAWNKMLQSSYASSSYQPNPAEIVYRGSDGTHAENYGQLYRDIAAAYVLAVRWAISQDAEYGNAAVRIMDAWSSKLTTISGNVDLYLAAGIYGYEFAQAGEIMRNFDGWSTEGFQRFKTMMITAFYKPINGWLEGHADWASYGRGVYPNWDLCLIAAAMSIGVLADDSAIYNQGISWFYNGTGNGQINEAVPFTFWYDNQVLGQTMESGRDQGHNTLNVALLGVIAQTAYNQGNDLFSYNGSIILAA